MLGEKVYEGQARVAQMRVLTEDKVEVTFQESGKMLGTDYTGIVTIIAVTRPDGRLYGEGNGLLTTRGGEAVTWTGCGLGWFREGGLVSWRGMKFHRTSSPRLARLNNVPIIFEFDETEQGSGIHSHYEWK